MKTEISRKRNINRKKSHTVFFTEISIISALVGAHQKLTRRRIYWTWKTDFLRTPVFLSMIYLSLYFSFLYLLGDSWNYMPPILVSSSAKRSQQKLKKRSCFVRLCLWYDCFDVSVVNYEHISHFFLIVDFEQANVCWVHIERTSTF